MDFEKLVKSTRSYRRFREKGHLSREVLVKLVEISRFTPSGGNWQPLKYIVSVDPMWNEKIFDTLGWAGFLKDWLGPEEGERPGGYIIMLTDTKIRDSADKDVGIAAQTMLMSATAQGLGGCMVGNIKRPELRRILEIPEHLKISLILALGKPIETVVLEIAEPGGSIEYYRTSDGTHHVPKRTQSEVLLKVLGD